VLQHEIAHALYHTDQEYFEAINSKFHDICATQVLADAYKILRDKGYGSDVLLDEAQAYCIGGKDILSHLEENERWKGFADFVRATFNEKYNALPK
jgi:hypothetical protein